MTNFNLNSGFKGVTLRNYNYKTNDFDLEFTIQEKVKEYKQKLDEAKERAEKRYDDFTAAVNDYQNSEDYKNAQAKLAKVVSIFELVGTALSGGSSGGGGTGSGSGESGSASGGASDALSSIGQTASDLASQASSMLPQLMSSAGQIAEAVPGLIENLANQVAESQTETGTETPTEEPEVLDTETVEPSASEPIVLEKMDVPEGNTSFKSYTKYTALAEGTPQSAVARGETMPYGKYEGVTYNTQTDPETGVRYVSFEGDDTKYYCVAMGTYYGEVGDIFKVTTDEGNTYNVIMCDVKGSDAVANASGETMYHDKGDNGYCVTEFYVDHYADDVKVYRDGEYIGTTGNYNDCSQFSGNIETIERLQYPESVTVNV